MHSLFYKAYPMVKLLACLPFLGLIASDKTYAHAEILETYEVSSTYSNLGDLLIGTMVKTKHGNQCAFSLSPNNGKTWSPPDIFRRRGFRIAGNPSVASDTTGTLYRICMSVQSNYSAGAIDMSYSTDRGSVWAPWREIISYKGRIADKPRLHITQGGVLVLSFTEVEVPANSSEFTTETKVLISNNHGVSWRPMDLGEFAKGGQGSYIATNQKTDDLSITWGRYGAQTPVFYFRSSRQGIFQSIVAETSDVEVPSTEVHIDPLTGRIIVLWSDTHTPTSPVFFSFSDDKGASWHQKIKLSDAGTMAAGAFATDGTFAFIWTEATLLNDNLISDITEGFAFHNVSKMKVLNRTFSRAGILSPELILSQTPNLVKPVYFGANQSVATLKDNLFALFIDWTSDVGNVKIKSLK